MCVRYTMLLSKNGAKTHSHEIPCGAHLLQETNPMDIKRRLMSQQRRELHLFSSFFLGRWELHRNDN